MRLPSAGDFGRIDFEPGQRKREERLHAPVHMGDQPERLRNPASGVECGLNRRHVQRILQYDQCVALRAGGEVAPDEPVSLRRTGQRIGGAEGDFRLRRNPRVFQIRHPAGEKGEWMPESVLCQIVSGLFEQVGRIEAKEAA